MTRTRAISLGVVTSLLVVFVVYNHALRARLDGLPLSGTSSQSHQRPESNFQESQTFTRHIVAVGDLHGDYPSAETVLHFSGVIDDHGDWSGDVDFFVQTGDIIDR
jgi:hypothetical protein